MSERAPGDPRVAHLEPAALERSRVVLDPEDRVAEVLFGLIMALSFTGAVEVGRGEGAELRELLAAALGCNIAWGLVDAVMFVVLGLVERGRRLASARAYVAAASEAEQRRILAQHIPAEMAALVRPEGLGRLREALRPRLSEGVRVTGEDLRGALAVFVLVVLATFPVVLPFLILDDAWVAKRASNAVALALLFAGGWVLGRRAGARPLRTGLGMVGIGVLLVACIMALGG